MPQGQNVVAIIGARGGSKGLPRKNIRPLAGKPLIAWSIEIARDCALVDRTIVSTDDAEIAEVARKFGAEVPFMRPAELGADFASTESYLTHAVEWLEREEGYRTDIVLFLQTTDIFRKKAHVESVIRNVLSDPTVDSSFVVYPDHKNYWRQYPDGFKRTDERGHGSRQLKEKVFREDTGIACATRARFIKAGRRIGDTVVPVFNEDTCSAIDIHTEFDLWLAEKVISEWGRKIND